MIPDFSVKNRIVCITGASSGLGSTIARAFCEAGAQVVGVARRPITHVPGVQADLSNLTAIAQVARDVSGVHGAPDVLINAAGCNPRQSAEEITPDIWRRTLDVNLSASLFLAQALVPAMKAKRWGRIINFASLQSTRAFSGGITYGPAKAGITQLTRAMAEAWSRYGITVNALAPGFFPTELTAPVFNDAEQAARNAAQTCIGRNGRDDDILGPAFYLASPASDYITGQVHYVDGGFTAK